MLWYQTTINGRKPVHTLYSPLYTVLYRLVQLVTILANLAFQRSAHDIHSIHMYTQLIALYVMSTPLKSQIRQDHDQLYNKVQEGIYEDVQGLKLL